MTEPDHIYMQRCLDIALNGRGMVAPNPLVGSVIVYENDIIGEGFHQIFGGPHAEVNAINSVKDQELLSQSTIYVNLEPCSHFGKTPPCADLIIRKKFKKVVIGMQDPNPVVSGNGIRKLRDAGIEVVTDVLKTECEELNKYFICYQTNKRPYIILKWASTADGYISRTQQQLETGSSNKITNKISDRLVHKWRSEVSAIMVGTNTALADNPELTVRHWAGKSPLRIVIDRNLRIPASYNLFNTSADTIIYNDRLNETRDNVVFAQIDFGGDLIGTIVSDLYKRGINSLLIEGGTIVLSQFINQGLWDEARIFQSDILFENGVKAPELNITSGQQFKIENDILTICKRKKGWLH